jgi:hypothetical protein
MNNVENFARDKPYKQTQQWLMVEERVMKGNNCDPLTGIVSLISSRDKKRTILYLHLILIFHVIIATELFLLLVDTSSKFSLIVHKLKQVK